MTRAGWAAVAILATAVLAALVWRGTDDDEPPPRRAGATPAAVSSVYAQARYGYSLRVPAGWRVREGRRATRLTGPGATVTIVVASPTSGSFVSRVARDTRRALLSSYRPARVVAAGRGRLGSARARTAELAGTAPGRRRVRILSAVAASRWRTYVVTVFAAVPPDAVRFVEAQRTLASLRFGRPGRGG